MRTLHAYLEDLYSRRYCNNMCWLFFRCVTLTTCRLQYTKYYQIRNNGLYLLYKINKSIVYSQPLPLSSILCIVAYNLCRYRLSRQNIRTLLLCDRWHTLIFGNRHRHIVHTYYITRCRQPPP